MKKYFIIALSLCAVMSCSKENTITNNTPLSFTAGFDEGTKSMLNNDRSQTWLGGDQVTIYDVTDNSTTSTKATFTNTSTDPSTSATFTIDPEFSSFEFVTGHKYLALHNATISSTGSEFILVNINRNITFASDRKYGMPDKTIPVACYFTYSGESSLQNISFHNVSALCVVRVTNNTSNSIDISKITLTESYTGSDWAGKFFGAAFVYFSKYGDYNWQCGSNGSPNETITCNNSIAASGTCDYSTIMMRPNSPYTSGEITLTVTVWDGVNCIAEKAVLVQPGNTPYMWKAGDTKVFNITVNPS